MEYALSRGMERVLGTLPRGAATRLGAGVGSLVRRPLAIRTGVVRENLRLAFPEAETVWIEEVTVECYRHLGREVAAMLRLSTLERGAVRDMVEFDESDWSVFEAARSEGRGVILATGHYGNWEMAAAAVAARGVPIAAIVKRQSNPLVDRQITKGRGALGIDTVDMALAPRKIPRALLAGKAVGIVGDQDAGHTGLFVPFFGVPASTHRGPATFALRIGSPLFATVARRRPDGTYLLTGKRIDTTATESYPDDVLRITAATAAHLEREIREDPTQYFWFHKRWKTRPVEEPEPRVAGIRSNSGQGDREP
jgi:Kdo2-lipid IVA lauroyltransferase/acyltransferase